MTRDVWLTETYFDWLRREAFVEREPQMRYDGALRVLHDIPFYWTPGFWSDENRAGDAQAFRQYEFLNFQGELDGLDQVWLGQWATAAPSVLEVLLGISRRWAYFFDKPVDVFFGILFRNMGLDRCRGKNLNVRTQEAIRDMIDGWLSHQFDPDGLGSPFPIGAPIQVDMTRLDIWGQMNQYSLAHFQ